MSTQIFAQLQLRRIRMLPQVSVERHQDAGRAEAALQGVVAAETFLKDGEPTWLRRETLDGAKVSAVDLNGERQARSRRAAVDLDRAGAAHAVLTTDMRAGEADGVTQKIGQQHARLGLGRRGSAVERELDDVPPVGAQARHRRASAIVSRPSRRTRS